MGELAYGGEKLCSFSCGQNNRDAILKSRMSISQPAPKTPTITKRASTSSPPNTPKNTVTRQQFLVAAANMGWQLAIAVLLPVIGGAELDKHTGGRHLWVFVGLGVAFVLSTAVMWRAIRLANRLPVPKLTEAEKRAIQKQYEEDEE